MIDTSQIRTLSGATVLDRDSNKVGTVGQLWVDPADGEPRWMSVRTGLFGMSESFVPLDDATVESDAVRIGYDKDFVKDAPRVDAEGELSESDENRLYDYYGMSHGTTAHTDTHRGIDDLGAGTGAGTRDRDFDRGTVGRDTSGPTTDDAMTRSEEQLRVDKDRVETGRARLRKYVVTEDQTVTVPVEREEVRVEREPITDRNRDDAMSGPELSDEEHEVTLTEERVSVDKETVPVERVRMDKERVTEEQRIHEDLKKEEIEVEDGTGRGTSGTMDDRDERRGDRGTTGL